MKPASSPEKSCSGGDRLLQSGMRLFSWLMLCLLVAHPSWAMAPSHEPRDNLTVLADEALMPPLAQIARAYARYGNTPVSVVAYQPETLAQQVEEGLEAHLLITADAALVETLNERGLTDVTSRRTVARTGLALVASRERADTLGIAKRISFASVLKASGTTPILTGEANTLEGARALDLSRTQPFSDTLRPRLVARANDDEVLAALRDEDALGLLLATQAIGQPDIVVISLLPDDISPPIAINAVVIGGELTDEAAAFADYLGSAEAKKILTYFGYRE